MKSTQILAACAILAVASALTTPSPVEQVPLGDDSQVSQDLFWIEYMKHGVMIQEEAIEDRKWELRRVCYSRSLLLLALRLSHQRLLHLSYSPS